MAIVYSYNRQIVPPGPLVNIIVRSPRDAELFVATPALIDSGAAYSAITPAILTGLLPLRVGRVYIEDYRGEGDTVNLYAVNIEIHNWRFPNVPVVVGSSDYVILGRDILNNFDLRLNGIDGKLEFLRAPQI